MRNLSTRSSQSSKCSKGSQVFSCSGYLNHLTKNCVSPFETRSFRMLFTRCWNMVLPARERRDHLLHSTNRMLEFLRQTWPEACQAFRAFPFHYVIRRDTH